MEQHWRRLSAALVGTYKPGHELWPAPGRESGYDGYWLELGHAVKNIWVEQFRLWGIELNPRRR